MNTLIRVTGGMILGCTALQAQIYPVAITIAPLGGAMNEGDSMQMNARLVYSSGGSALIEASRVQWQVPGSAQPATVSANCLLVAGRVYQDTQIIINASYQGFQNQTPVLIRNIDPDDYGAYAHDGLDDAWQVENFGKDNARAAPSADPDGDGQDNLTEFIAGTQPLNRQSLLFCAVSPVQPLPGQPRIDISPILPGRTYRLESSTDLHPAHWQTVAAAANDSGTVRSVVDLPSTSPARFYRVIVSKP